MSKAFTNEEPESAPVIRAPVRLAPGEKRYITPAGFAALGREFDEAQAAMPKATGREREALEAKAAGLATLIEHLTVVDAPADPDRVFFGAEVELEDEDGGRVVYRLVGPDEIDIKSGRISIESPVGRALLGRREGDSAMVQRPKGPLEYTVIRINYRS